MQEFQYGNNVFQTTTTNVSVSGGCVISCLKTSFVGYGNIEWYEASGRGFESHPHHKSPHRNRYMEQKNTHQSSLSQG